MSEESNSKHLQQGLYATFLIEKEQNKTHIYTHNRTV